MRLHRYICREFLKNPHLDCKVGVFLWGVIMNDIIKTKRLSLRKFTKSDLEALADILADSDVMRYSMKGVMDKYQSMEMLRQWIENYENNILAPWALIMEGDLIGYAGLDVRIIEGEEKVQITFRLAKEFWGRGYATEIAAAIKNYAFSELGLNEIIAIVDPDNIGSIKTIEKIGMTFDREVNYEGLYLHVYKAIQSY